ncbi:protease modulator HflC [Roseinatronobacter monicus]|uniref:Protein HflC n=1 Tax=Roseinatronobacter monicus TaxID=393481 RepID=A0A543KEP9_9RHOB|nr:protease modulator HflC [Roseinatronobacter monicus]TQM93497.1 protease FtsH subunit HflC [Roseinatronobacter monicus]
MKKAGILLPVAVVAIVTAFSALFIVDERENVLVLQFGQVKQEITEPGLGFKIPFIQEVVRYDARILGLQTQPLEVTPLDDRRLVVDAFLRWRLTDVRRFREAVGVDGVRAAQGRMDRIMNAAIREVLGAVPSTAVLSEDRTGLMNRIRDLARRESETLGIEVIDVRLTRTDLPQENLEATFARMRAEREREAADERARGNEAAQRVRALADRTVIELVSASRREAEIIRGEADAERNRVYADAYNLDPEFFAFSRSMQSYESALRGDNASMVLRPDSEFFTFLRSDGASENVLQAARDAADALEDDPDMLMQRAPESDPDEPDAVRELEAIIGN